MAYDGRAIANFILDFCEERNRAVSNLSLQKIIYFCHVWSLINLQRPLIKQEFEAWKFGPVLQYVYREFRNFDDQPITTRASHLDPFSGQRLAIFYRFDQETGSHLSVVADFYSQLRAAQLVDLSHVRGGPWWREWHHEGKTNPGMKIKNENIVEFYSKVRKPFSLQ